MFSCGWRPLDLHRGREQRSFGPDESSGQNLFQLRTRVRVALLHYAPCRATLEGEPLEIFPFLGATRLSGPLDQLRPALAIHGHAHRGNLRGATRGGVPVYNVALPVLRRLEKPVGFYLLDV